MHKASCVEQPDSGSVPDYYF